MPAGPRSWVPGFIVNCAVAFGVVFKLELCKCHPGELSLAPGHFELSLKFPLCGVSVRCVYHLAPKQMEIIQYSPVLEGKTI